MLAQLEQTCKTQRTLVNPNAIPRELWTYKQFVCWKYVDRGKPKLDKVPVNPRNLSNAGVTWPNTWSSINAAVAIYRERTSLAGIAYVLTDHDPFTMVDIDNCLTEGNLSPFAAEVVSALDTYWEISPSGHGLRGFVRCEQQPATLKRTEIEIYSRERFATLTGNTLHNRPIARVASLDWLIGRFIDEGKTEEKTHETHRFPPQGAPAPSDDQSLWQRIFAVNDLARDIYSGNLTSIRTGPDGLPDESRAVILLLNSLALWTKGDASRMRAMMYQTSLDKSKWGEKRKGQDWLTGRINDAINYMAGRVR